jgi:hypothetical protein
MEDGGKEEGGRAARVGRKGRKGGRRKGGMGEFC